MVSRIRRGWFLGVALSLVAVLAACSAPSDSPEQTGAVTLEFVNNKAVGALAQSVSEATVTVLGEGMSPQRHALTIAAGRVTGRLEDIPVGVRIVEVALKDASGLLLWFAQTEVTVAKGGVARASLAWQDLGGGNDSGTGVDYTTPNGTKHQMVLVPAGEFIMGSANGDADELPELHVFLDAFSIDKFEVTNSQYQAFVKATDRAQPAFSDDADLNGDDQPVVGVTWPDARDYCEWAQLRLPTEAEWEKAARGPDALEYPWGTGLDGSKANLGTEACCGGSAADGFFFTAPVGTYGEGVSVYGVHDMAGNVWEWVEDFYDAEYYSVSPAHNPPGPDSAPTRVFRGGSWFNPPDQARSANRGSFGGGGSDKDGGFRCARDG